MSDLISREKLIEAMENKYVVAKEECLYDKDLSYGFLVTEKIIKEQPTISELVVQHHLNQQKK